MPAARAKRTSPLASPAVRRLSPVAVDAVHRAAQHRRDQLDFFVRVLRTTTSKRQAPYSVRTIGAYRDAVIALDKWLAARNFAEDFCGVNTALLNDFFREYRAANTQGGTATKQGNLIHFFTWLETEEGHPHPYTERLDRYAHADPEEQVAVLDKSLISDLLTVTSGRDFLSLRDHAIIRLFLTGIRREELARLGLDSIDLDQNVLTTVGLKGRPARVVPFGEKTAIALTRYLRARSRHRMAGLPALWLAERNSKPLDSSGVYQMLKRRVAQTGRPKESVRPHMFRHTFAHEYLSDGGSEGSLMRLVGWKSRSMVDRYAARQAQERAIKDAHHRGLDDRH